MAKRELINTGTDKRFVRRAKDGTFKESEDVGRSLAAPSAQSDNEGENLATLTKATADHGGHSSIHRTDQAAGKLELYLPLSHPKHNRAFIRAVR